MLNPVQGKNPAAYRVFGVTLRAKAACDVALLNEVIAFRAPLAFRRAPSAHAEMQMTVLNNIGVSFQGPVRRWRAVQVLRAPAERDFTPWKDTFCSAQLFQGRWNDQPQGWCNPSL